MYNYPSKIELPLDKLTIIIGLQILNKTTNNTLSDYYQNIRGLNENWPLSFLNQFLQTIVIILYPVKYGSKFKTSIVRHKMATLKFRIFGVS